MRKFCLYIELNQNGKIPVESRKVIEKIIDLLFDCEVLFVWRFNDTNVSYRKLKPIIFYERKICDKKGFVLYNRVSASKIGVLVRALMQKYKFVVEEKKEQLLLEDYKRACFMNSPKSCDFNSCLGTTLLIDREGNTGICPFIENQIELNDVSDIDDIRQLFSTDTFAELMKKNIEKRNKCKSNCDKFAFCKGGCPLVSDEGECLTRTRIAETFGRMSKQNLNDDEYREQCIEKISSIYKV